jgi:alpha-L-arabinofuranosidase
VLRSRYGDRACDLESSAYGDLVEYCWGNASTALGRQRIADGHPSVYNVTYWELGATLLFVWHRAKHDLTEISPAYEPDHWLT